MSDQDYFTGMAKAESGKPKGLPERLKEIGTSEREVYDQLLKFGVPQLDAGLITDCLNVGKACMWQNDDPIENGAVEKVNALILEKNLGMRVIASPSRWGKTIWEVKKNQIID